MPYVRVTSQMRERLERFTSLFPNTVEILQNRERRLETSTYNGPFSVKPSRQKSFPAGEVPWHGSAGQLSRALTRSAAGQDGNMVQAWSGPFRTAPAIVGLGSYKHLKLNLEKRRCAQESEAEGGGSMLGKIHTHLSN